MPIALGRSCSLKSTVSAARDITITPAPANPSSTRAAMKAPLDGAAAQAPDPTPNSASATSITRLRP